MGRNSKAGEAAKDELVVCGRYELSQSGKRTIKVQRIDVETGATVESNTITVTVTPQAVGQLGLERGIQICLTQRSYECLSFFFPALSGWQMLALGFLAEAD